MAVSFKAFDSAIIASALAWTANHWEEFAQELELPDEELDAAKKRLDHLAFKGSMLALSTKEAREWQARKASQP